MRCEYACHSQEHGIARRTFLGSLIGGSAAAAGLGAMVTPAIAADLARRQKQVLVIWMHGGVSQLETWDPKPKTDTGGPFRAIPTSLPGVHVSELLPHTAKQMHRLSLIRSINTQENDHSKGAYIMHTGRRKEPSTDYPQLGAVAAKFLAPQDSPLPGFIHVTPRGDGNSSQSDAAYLGPKFGSVSLSDGHPPSNLLRPASLSETAAMARNAFRQKATDRFSQRRRTADTEAYTYSYEQAAQLMERRELFDVTKEPARDQERYGTHDFGRHCLLARRLLENGVTFVKVTHSNYDTHYANFDFHIEQLGEFDRTFATLLDDLAVRGRLENTLVVVMSEFGRTPRINQNYGRDHWGTAWSVALGGCGIQPGAVIGKTNVNGTEVTDRQVDGGHLFHTYLRAVGLDPTESFLVGGRPMPLADPAAKPIEELLA